ncbi:MAG: response regulator [Proteobacteria bacterium]|nr:MAG: response regulator [Pseudomonadota bacterium]
MIDSRKEAIDAFRVKCLLVDDLQENLTALEALLENQGVELYSARSGVEALDLMLQHDFGLALVDVQMPQMDGFELAELMRGSERTRQTPIIFLTAGSWNRERIFKGYESGAVDFMFKPLEPRILRSKVSVFVELHRQKLRLADAEERYALSTSAAQVGTWEMSVDSDEMVCSDIGLRLFGLDAASPVIKRSELISRIHPADRQHFEAKLQLTMTTGAPLDVQFRVLFTFSSEFCLSAAWFVGSMQTVKPLQPRKGRSLASLVFTPTSRQRKSQPTLSCALKKKRTQPTG